MSVSGTGIEQVWFGREGLERSPCKQGIKRRSEQARGPVTSTGRREVFAGSSIQARKLCLLFCRPTPPIVCFEGGGGEGARVAGVTEGNVFLFRKVLLQLDRTSRMVPYHSEAWSSETTAGRTSWEPGRYHSRERYVK